MQGAISYNWKLYYYLKFSPQPNKFRDHQKDSLHSFYAADLPLSITITYLFTEPRFAGVVVPMWYDCKLNKYKFYQHHNSILTHRGTYFLVMHQHEAPSFLAKSPTIRNGTVNNNRARNLFWNQSAENCLILGSWWVVVDNNRLPSVKAFLPKVRNDCKC